MLSRLRSSPLSAQVALLPVAGLSILCFAGFAGWTLLISFTDSGLLPHYHFVGLQQYARLFSSERWWRTLANFMTVGAILVIGCSVVGYTLAAAIDRCGRGVAIFSTIFMVPVSMSSVVTGVIWQWLFNPATGLQSLVGIMGFKIDWLVRTDRAIYIVAIASIWQQTGMSVALFLAGLRGVDPDIRRACAIDGVPAWRFYGQIVAPLLTHVFALNAVLLIAVAAKSFDLVIVLTAGGPGFASDVPARFIMEHILERQELALGAAGASVMMLAVFIALCPYVYLRFAKRGAA